MNSIKYGILIYMECTDALLGRLYRTKIYLLSVLIFSCAASTAQSWFSTYQNADLMISGVDFNNTGGALSFNHPCGLATDGTRLIVCDRSNNRVLVWNTLPANWNTPPDFVLGQSNFTTNNPGTSKSEMNFPGNASLASNGILVVADTDNDRILIWLTFPAFSGQPADISIQLGFPTPLLWPWGVWTDGTRLSAVGTSGATIFFWNTMPTADNQPADYTINLPQFGTPRNISTDGSTYFFVGDHNANVPGGPEVTFFWNSYPATANQPYDYFRTVKLKGATMPGGEMVAAATNAIWVWNTMPTDSIQPPDQIVMPSYYNANGEGPDVVYAGNKIYVNNVNGNDILVYDSIPTTANPDASYAIGVFDFYNHNTLDSIGYIQNPVPATDGTLLIVTSDFTHKIYFYNSLPASSGILPDSIVQSPISMWDNALFNNKFVTAGFTQVAVWNNASQVTSPPSQIFNNNIGTASFTNLKGVALDSQFFYLADQSGKLFIWNGIPADSSVNPLYTITLTGAQLNRISSDGYYFCVTKSNPPSEIYIYKVSDIVLGILTPWKTVSAGFLNLVSDAVAFNGSFAIANQGNNSVLLWQNINDAGDTNSVIVLGQPDLQNTAPAIGQNRLYYPATLMPVANYLWVGEFKFSSRLLRFGYATSGIETNPAGDAEIICYPNPFSNSTTIQITNVVIMNFELKIYDLFGREARKYNIKNQKTEIYRDDLPGGMYFYQVEQNEIPNAFGMKSQQQIIGMGKIIVNN